MDFRGRDIGESGRERDGKRTHHGEEDRAQSMDRTRVRQGIMGRGQDGTGTWERIRWSGVRTGTRQGGIGVMYKKMGLDCKGTVQRGEVRD